MRKCADISGIRVSDENSDATIARQMRDPHLAEQDRELVARPDDQRQEDDQLVHVEAVIASADVGSPLQRRLLGVALLALPAVDRLQHHDRVVHQHAHAEHQAHHGEDVEVLAR